jgi:hypothetical protein
MLPRLRISHLAVAPYIVSQWPTCLRKESCGKSIARFAVVSMCAFGFRLGFGHIRARFSLAVPPRAFAVVDIGRGIQPNLTRSTAWRWSGSIGTCLCCWRWGWGRSCSGCWLRRSWRGCRWFVRGSRSWACIPLFYALMAPAGALLCCRSRVRTVIAHAG